MDLSEVTLAMVALLLLRLALPLLVTLFFGRTMNRLLDHWNTNLEQ
jgi:hypothetical protein